MTGRLSPTRRGIGAPVLSVLATLHMLAAPDTQADPRPGSTGTLTTAAPDGLMPGSNQAIVPHLGLFQIGLTSYSALLALVTAPAE